MFLQQLAVAEEERAEALPPPSPAPTAPTTAAPTAHPVPTASSLDPLNPNYYDPNSYTSSSIHAHFAPASSSSAAAAGPSSVGVDASEGGDSKMTKQELAREKNREKQRRFRERQKIKLAELEEQLIRLKEEGEDEMEEEEPPMNGPGPVEVAVAAAAVVPEGVVDGGAGVVVQEEVAMEGVATAAEGN